MTGRTRSGAEWITSTWSSVICGEDAYLAKGVAAELTIAQEKNTPYFLLTAYANRTCTRPTSAMPSDKVYEWTWDNLKTLIGGWR